MHYYKIGKDHPMYGKIFTKNRPGDPKNPGVFASVSALHKNPKSGITDKHITKMAFWKGFEKEAGSFHEDKPLYQPTASSRPGKKKMVYVKSPGGGKKLIHYGASGYKHNYSEGAKKNFRARHGCDKPGLDKNTPRYWACQDLWPKS